MSPLITALFIVLCVGLVGALVAFVRDRARYAGYRDLMREAIAFSRTIDGEIFRDGKDLVISGEHLKMPLVVRFSHAEHTPGLSIRLVAPATFSMTVFARGQEDHPGSLIKTADDAFNTKFEVRTDQPTEARLFLGNPRVLTAITRLCRSSYDFLTIGSGTIEFGQLGYPTESTVRAVPGYVEALGTVLRDLREMPGADQVKLEPRQRRHDYILRATIAVGIVAAAATLYVTREQPSREQSVQAQNPTPEGMSPADAAMISNLQNWRSVTADDAGNVMVGWLRGQGLDFTAHLALDMNGTGEKNDVAYLLVNDRGQRRIILIIDGAKAYDSRFSQIAGIARIPKGALADVQWKGSPAEPQGDALLLVRNAEDPQSGLLLFYGAGGKIMSASPENWQQLRVSE